MRGLGALILPTTFEDRLEVIELLRSASVAKGGDADALREAASRLDSVSVRLADERISAVYSAFSDLVRIAAMLVDWRYNVLEAGSDSDRFKRAALERIALWRTEYSSHTAAGELLDAVKSVDESLSITDVGPLCLKLARISLPVGVYGDVPKGPTFGPWVRRQSEDKAESSPELTVAFLSFTVDTKPADQLHFLSPHETHDLEIEVRVSRWPEGTAELNLSPLSIEAASTYEFPVFRFERPSGSPPFTMKQRGRAIINAAQANLARPFEFRYAAEFLPKQAEQPVSVVGHRTLRIESVDLQQSPITGYANLDRRLLDLGELLRREPAIPQDDLEAAMTLATNLAKVAAQSVADNIFPDSISEKEFQEYILGELRRTPSIASKLEVHPHAGGGITDLSLEGVRLELKVEAKQFMKLGNCQKFVEQAAAYVVGSSKRIGLLCVLDTSPKQHAAFPADDGIGILRAKSGVLILTILIQGRLGQPSSLSK